jgi:hypothetical protein
MTYRKNAVAYVPNGQSIDGRAADNEGGCFEAVVKARARCGGGSRVYRYCRRADVFYEQQNGKQQHQPEKKLGKV